MYLREFKKADAVRMLEWMHDNDVVKHLKGDFNNKSLKDAEAFIASNNSDNNVHYAICDTDDNYMGTVSLKSINKEDLYAEFAIVVHKDAMNQGYAWYGMKTILVKALSEYNLENVYWCVSQKNERAIRFYEKHNFERTKSVPAELALSYTDCDDLIWYCVNLDNISNSIDLSSCKLKNIRTIKDDTGALSFFEANHDIPFDIKRIYYITNVKSGMKRGFHAHKNLKQFIYCPYGKVKMHLDDGKEKTEIVLANAHAGLIIDKCCWREMEWLNDDSVLIVAASDYYYEDDYIREYDKFIKYIGENI